jgi:phosphatidylserine/phosphatidylglycerophosphate/cardiolipin synthase-like enzyme
MAEVLDLTKYKTSDHHQEYDASVHVGGIIKTEIRDPEVLFRNLQERLCELIRSHAENCAEEGFIVGAVAWLSNSKILEALGFAHSHGCLVMLVIQKEDFLRPESSEGYDSWVKRIRKQYAALGENVDTDWSSWAEKVLMFGSDTGFFGERPSGQFWWNDSGDFPSCDAVRCVGNHNAKKEPSFPRMHNKFLVFGKFVESSERHGDVDAVPLFVWTGSFNCSAAAERSFENALILHDKELALRYAQEFSMLFLLSEPLDWKSQWMCPQSFYST